MKKLQSYAVILAGITLTAAAAGLFFIPNEIVTGGVSGIAAILYPLGIPPGAVYLILNLFLLTASYKYLGKEFVFHSILSVITLSFLVQFFSSLPPITSNTLLATLFGSVLFGFGAALTFIKNANTGGTDIIGRLLQMRMSHIPIGNLLLIIDGCIILTSFLISKNVDRTLFGMLGLFISTFFIDLTISRLNSSRIAFIISEKGDKLARLLIENSSRGVTQLNALGAYTRCEKKLLICAIKSREMPAFQTLVDTVDPNAFTIFIRSEKIFGLGFYVYK